MLARSVLDLIGNTPLLEIAGVYAKLEFLNPSGSLKDRMAHHMIKKAEAAGALAPGMKIYEATTGNTGIAFAMVSTLKGYAFTAVMPESMSHERRELIRGYGGDLILTPAEEDVAGTIARFNEIRAEEPDAWYPLQFENPDNIESHYLTTGKEIARDLDTVDVFIAGVGTGGSIMGIGKALREVNPDVQLVAVEPTESPVMNGGTPGVHGIQGIGEGFIPPLVDMDQIDEIYTVDTQQAIAAAQTLWHRHGLFVGISSGANFLAAQHFAKQHDTVATLMCDSGNRYLSVFDVKVCG